MPRKYNDKQSSRNATIERNMERRTYAAVNGISEKWARAFLEMNSFCFTMFHGVSSWLVLYICALNCYKLVIN